MEINIERDCSMLGGLFQAVINDLKGSVPVWEDFVAKSTKLHSQLRTTVVALTAFLESFQRVADVATNSRGGTKELGASLTRLCLRHKSIEFKFKSLTNSLMDCLVLPIQERIEDWKKITVQLDKDHAKEYKKARQEIKKKSSDTLRLQKKARKGKTGVQYQLDTAMQDVNDMYILLEETEKKSVRDALIEERSRFCCFVNAFKPVLEEEVSMLGEMVHLQSVIDELTDRCKDPLVLPPSSEQVITDLKGQDGNLSYTPPPSPTMSSDSRKSSVCGSLSSMNSSDSRSSSSLTSGNSAHSHPSATQPGHHHRHRSLSTPLNPAHRLSSVSSQDSGFTSQDTLFLRPGTPTSQNQLAQQGIPITAPGMLLEGDMQVASSTSSSECSTPSTSPIFQYGSLPPSSTPTPESTQNQPINSNASRRPSRPKAVATPFVPATKKSPVDEPLTPPVDTSGPVPEFSNNTQNQGIYSPRFQGNYMNADWKHRSATLPNRRSHSISAPFSLPGTNSYPHSLSSAATSESHLNRSQDSGYSETGSQVLPPPAGFESADGFGNPENEYLVSDTEFLTYDCLRVDASIEVPPLSPLQPIYDHIRTGEHQFQNHQQHHFRYSTAQPLQEQSGGTQIHRRHSSLGTIRYSVPDPAKKRNKPPPPVRRTPSGSALSTLQAGVVMESSYMNLSQSQQRAQQEVRLDRSGKFKVPPPVRAKPQQDASCIYDVPRPQGRAPPVARSQSMKLPGEGALAGNMNRMSLMESLNAKLSERKSPPKHKNLNVTSPDKTDNDYQVPTSCLPQRNTQHAHPSNQQDNIYVERGDRTPQHDAESIYYFPTNSGYVNTTQIGHHTMHHPEPEVNSNVTYKPAGSNDLTEKDEAPSALQAALKLRSKSLRKVETYDRSAPKIPNSN